MEKYKQLIGQIILVNSRDMFKDDGYNMVVTGTLEKVETTHLVISTHCGKFLVKYETIIYVLRVEDGKWINGDWNGRC